jgi:hypothetical protein
LIWHLLSQENGMTKEELPLTFLNQMYILTKVFHDKLSAFYKKLILLREDKVLHNQQAQKENHLETRDFNNQVTESEKTISKDYESDLKDFFKVNRQLEASMKKFDFNLI